MLGSYTKILILGGSGFIGHHLVRRFISEGKQVRVLVRPTSDRFLLRNLPVEFIEGDLENTHTLKLAVQGCDALVHAAGYYPIYSLRPKSHEQRGIRQIHHIHAALSQSSIRRFLYISSPTAVGRYPDGRAEDEKAPYPHWRDFSAYCRVKRAMQQEVLKYAAKFDSVVVAPTAVFGEEDPKPTTSRLMLDIAHGRVPVMISGRTNAVDVHDVAQGVSRALERGKTGRLYVIGGENLSLPALMQRISRIVNRKAPLITISPRPLLPLAYFSEIIGKLTKMNAPLIPMVGLHFAMVGEFLSSDVARRELEYTPTRKIDDALVRAFQWLNK